MNGLRLACEAEAAAEGGGVGAGTGGLWPLAVCCTRAAGRSGTALAADSLLHIVDNNQVHTQRDTRAHKQNNQCRHAYTHTEQQPSTVTITHTHIQNNNQVPAR